MEAQDKNQTTDDCAEILEPTTESKMPVIRAKTPPARAHSEKISVSQPNRGTFKKRLNDLLDDGDLEEAVGTIREALKANKTHWDGVAKRMVEEPDYRIRMEASKTILSYKEGMPVQRQVVMQESFESLRDAIMAASHSEEAKRIIEQELLTLPPNWDNAPPTE